MRSSVDFESLYRTEFLDKKGKDKNVLGIKSNPYWYLLLENPFTYMVFLISMMWMLVYFELPWYIGFATIIIMFILAGTILLHNDTKYKLKDETLSPIIKAINPSFKYNHQNYISKEVFKASKISSRSIWSYAGNDLAMGKIDGNFIMFSDLLVKSFMQTVFHGQFIVTEFNKNFEGATVVSTDNAEVIFGKVLGGFIQSSLSGDSLIRMDSPTFEEAFVVHSTDSVEAHYILSSSLMERMLSYKEKSGQLIEFSFFGNVVCIAIAYDKDHFEYLDTERFTSEAALKEAFDREFAQPLALVTEIIDDLKLNEKLWSKR